MIFTLKYVRFHNSTINRLSTGNRLRKSTPKIIVEHKYFERSQFEGKQKHSFTNHQSSHSVQINKHAQEENAIHIIRTCANTTQHFVFQTKERFWADDECPQQEHWRQFSR